MRNNRIKKKYKFKIDKNKILLKWKPILDNINNDFKNSYVQSDSSRFMKIKIEAIDTEYFNATVKSFAKTFENTDIK